jgi:type I restriction enzyme R subunit
MRPYNEADTRAKLIDPRLKLAGWGEGQIEREHYFVKGRTITNGRIYLVGETSRRRQPRRVDYLLRYHGQMIAVIEAKDETHSADAGLEQAKEYARMLDVPFAYASNGHGFVEFDFFLNRSRELDAFPRPDNLWNRWQQMRVTSREVYETELAAETHPEDSAALGRPADPLLYPYCPASICGKEPHYFQEVAIRRVIERIMRQQRRILLTMATGTGKTFTAFQLVWKLKKSGWLRKPVLFIADRIVLRDQAYNTFAPFVSGQADPRGLIEGGRFNPHRELYFALYQALDADDGNAPLFKHIPQDFFGLIIIDECHRSGFGKWNAILQHFPEAIQLGMTATPKQDENIDTYAYFCSEEPTIPLNPADPAQGTWRPPAYLYSFGQGIEDGFLATYKVHKVRTSVDRDGLHVADARVQGAEIYVPEDAELRDFYLTPQFEREITLPDRTEAMVRHLAGLLRRFGPMEKTMVFCVDMDHARLTARLLQNAFADLGFADYAVPIIAEEGQALTWLEQFQDSDRKTPVVATTAELLSTGVDVPACRNIVFMKPIASRVLFKQIIGRGSRVDQATGKEWFRIIDYVGASRLFDDWDRPPGEPPGEIVGPQTSILEGTVLDADTGYLVVGASISVLIGPNQQRGPMRTDNDGSFCFANLPAGTLQVTIQATGFRPRTVRVDTEPDVAQRMAIELQPAKRAVGKIRVRGLEVTIADEATFLVESTGEQRTLEQYLDYTREKVVGYVPDWARLHEVWTDPAKRGPFIQALEAASVHVEVLADVLARPEADQYDLLAHIAFDKPIHTRSERAEAFLNREQSFIQAQNQHAREVVLALLDKYRLAGVQEMARPEVFRLSPFREMGQLPGVIKCFGSTDALRHTLHEMQQRLYREETA